MQKGNTFLQPLLTVPVSCVRVEVHSGSTTADLLTNIVTSCIARCWAVIHLRLLETTVDLEEMAVLKLRGAGDVSTCSYYVQSLSLYHMLPVRIS